MSGSLRSLAYAAVLCTVCGLLLTAASSGLQPIQERNVRIDRHRNILTAAGLIPEDAKTSAADIEALYSQRIRMLRVDAVGRVRAATDPPEGALPLYLVVEDDDRIEAYIVPIDARGLWGPISAYLAFGNDGATVKGFTVNRHAETPGLGGEIENRRWQAGWQGKQVYGPKGTVALKVAKGRASDNEQEAIHQIDGLSGATLTGKGVSNLLRFWFGEHGYQPFLDKMRKQGGANG